MKRALYVMFIVMFSAVSTAKTPGNPEVLLATSNFWGVSISSYRTNVAEALQFSYDESVLEEWFSNVCLYDEFPNSDTNALWLMEKGRCVGEMSCMAEISASTNSWIDAADLLGRLRVISENNVFPTATNVSFSTEAEWSAYFGERSLRIRQFQMRRNSCEMAMREARHAVTDVFPWNILPRMQPDLRISIVSNIAARAFVEVDDVGALVRNILRRKEEGEE